jgi:hypothetical protein
VSYWSVAAVILGSVIDVTAAAIVTEDLLPRSTVYRLWIVTSLVQSPQQHSLVKYRPIGLLSQQHDCRRRVVSRLIIEEWQLQNSVTDSTGM